MSELIAKAERHMAACVAAFEGIPTEAIRPGMVREMVELLEAALELRSLASMAQDSHGADCSPHAAFEADEKAKEIDSNARTFLASLNPEDQK